MAKERKKDLINRVITILYVSSRDREESESVCVMF